MAAYSTCSIAFYELLFSSLSGLVAPLQGDSCLGFSRCDSGMPCMISRAHHKSHKINQLPSIVTNFSTTCKSSADGLRAPACIGIQVLDCIAIMPLPYYSGLGHWLLSFIEHPKTAFDSIIAIKSSPCLQWSHFRWIVNTKISFQAAPWPALVVAIGHPDEHMTSSLSP